MASRIAQILIYILIILNVLHFCSLFVYSLDTSLDELLNTKISTAAKYEQSLFEAPASISIVTSEEIEIYNLKTLKDILEHTRIFYKKRQKLQLFRSAWLRQTFQLQQQQPFIDKWSRNK